MPKCSDDSSPAAKLARLASVAAPLRYASAPYGSIVGARKDRGIGYAKGRARRSRARLSRRTRPASPKPREVAVSRSVRSEEHTSELQSPDHLVCRLLLEKK